ncbi:MAG: Clp protease ClpP [Fretibacterium sp.]|nr:Clp protease ClpP [Fretibacterium sp.]
MWKITAKSESDAEILLYDVIGGYDDNLEYQGAKNLIGKVKALGDVKNITLRINSIGGDVFEAQAMYSYLRSHPANVTVRVDGLAASAASLVAMAGDKVIMPANALMMIHNPAGLAMGEAEDMRETADILDKVRDSIAAAYVQKTGMEREKVISMMDAETWMSAEEAHKLGFCDEVDGAVEIAAMAGRGGGVFCRSALGAARLSPSIAASLPEEFRKTIHPMEDENEMKIENVTDLEREFPALTAEIRNAATAAERERLKALDDLAMPGGEAIIAKAKYEEPKDARDIAVELLQAARSNAALTARIQDAAAVEPALGPQGEKQTKQEEIVDMISKNINSMRGYH